MTNTVNLSMRIVGVLLAAGLSACDSGVQAPPAEALVAQPAYYPANNCRSAYAQTTQKGCLAELPHRTAKNVSR